MLSKEEFVRRILDGVSPSIDTESQIAPGEGMLEDFDGFDTPTASEVEQADRYAKLLLIESGLGEGEALPRTEVVLGDQKTNRFLPNGATYWAKTSGRPFHILLFDLELKGSAILADGFFKRNDQLEDALHRVVQDALEGFERGGEGRTADRKQGAQTETLCVVSVVDDRQNEPERQIVCFGTKCTTTEALEIFTLREEARDWDRPLAEEHLGQLFERHFKRLGTGARWQDAFISGDERKKACKLMDKCACLIPDEKQLQTGIRELLDEIAGSFGLRRKGGRRGHRLVMHALPEDHSIAVDAEDARLEGFKNRFQGLRIFDADERLIGYIVYVLDNRTEAERLHRQLAEHNHFHNVLVVYPDMAGATLELWQGTEPLRGRLISGTRRSRFDGEGGVVQLLSRFFIVSRSAIGTPEHLATELAWRAQHLKALAVDELHKEMSKPPDQRPLRDLLDIFNQALATLDETQFADAYAQTITYGLLAARWLSSGQRDIRFTRKNIGALLPSTSPFLHELFNRLVNSRFDQNISWLLDDITSLLARTMVAEVFQGERDPSIHFYQDFLTAYDPQIRRTQGVYYTPDEVVAYIVRSVHRVLQKRYHLPLGLADTTNWHDYSATHGVDIPPQANPEDAVVQLLDPAVGTGTFLFEVVRVVYEEMVADYERRGITGRDLHREWTRYVREYLLSRLRGFELMMAPYIVSHLRIGLALQQTGFTFGARDRLQIFLTNTLEKGLSPQLALIGERVAEEAAAARAVKTEQPLSVLVGNPPYRNFDSNNKTEWISELLVHYKEGLNERKLNLDDDYIKFLRWCHARLDNSPVAVLGLVTNSSYLDGATHRRVRQTLLSDFPRAVITNLRGNIRRREIAPEGQSNENVFDIQQGTCIGVFERPLPCEDTESVREVLYADVWGTRSEKLWALARRSLEHAAIQPVGPLYLLVPYDDTFEREYAKFPSLTDLFRTIGQGLQTKRDYVAIQYSREALEQVLCELKAEDPGDFAEARGIPLESASWSVMRARADILDNQGRIIDLLVRPFDGRFTYFTGTTNGFHARPRTKSTQNILAGNLALVAKRQSKETHFSNVFAVNKPINEGFFSIDPRGRETLFPLHLRGRAEFVEQDTSNIDLSCFSEGTTPKSAFNYLYAVMHSNTYRERYADLLKQQFPRIPTRCSTDLFEQLVQLGEDLVTLHTLTRPAEKAVHRFDGSLPGIVKKFAYKSRAIIVEGLGQFCNVSQEEYDFRLGGYQLCSKWLKDRRRDRVELRQREVRSFLNILDSISETRVLQAKVDKAIEMAGGWDSAFSMAGDL